MSSDRPIDQFEKAGTDKMGWQSWNNCLFLLAFYGIAIIYGARQIWFWKQSPMDIFLPFAMALCLAVCGLEDVRRRKYKIPANSKPYFFLFGIVVVPGYVVWNRGWRGLGWIAFHAFDWIMLTGVTQQIGGLIVFGDEWWQQATRHKSAN